MRCEANFVKDEYRPTKDTVFNQANKKDAMKVTDGKYTMSTTKKGRYIHRTQPYDVQLKKLWRIGKECGRLAVNYRMGHTLQDMGIHLKPTDWSKVVLKRRSSSSMSFNSPQGSPQSRSPSSSPSGSPRFPCEQEDIKPRIALQIRS